jgi:hypothetical protein
VPRTYRKLLASAAISAAGVALGYLLTVVQSGEVAVPSRELTVAVLAWAVASVRTLSAPAVQAEPVAAEPAEEPKPSA